MLDNWPDLACCENAIRPDQLKVALGLVSFLKVAEVWGVELGLLSMVWCCLTLGLFCWVNVLRWQGLCRKL